jgi:hypothetical protein
MAETTTERYTLFVCDSTNKVGKAEARAMTESEREIFMSLLIDLFLKWPAIERLKREKRAAIQSNSNTQTLSDRTIDFSKDLSITPLSPYAEL